MPDRGGFRIDRHLYFRGHSGGGDGGKCPECPFFIIQPPRSGTPGWLFSLFHATDPPFSNKPPGWGGQSGWLFNFGPRRTLPECRCGRRAASFSHLEGHSGVAFVNIHGLGRSGLLIRVGSVQFEADYSWWRGLNPTECPISPRSYRPPCKCGLRGDGA